MRKETVPQKDFSSKDLPRSYPALYFDIVKNQWRLLLGTSLLLSPFLLPLFADFLVFSLLLRGASMNGADVTSIMSLLLYMCVFAIPCCMILFVGLSGSTYAAKRLALGEGAFSTSSFFLGMKEGWKQGLVTGFFFGLSGAAAFYGSLSLLLSPSDNPILRGSGIGGLVVLFFMISTETRYSLASGHLYELSMGDRVRNSFAFVFLRLPFNLLAFLITPGSFVALFLLSEVSGAIAIIVLLFLNFAFTLGWSLLIQSTFDKYINKTNYPELYRKRLYKSQED